MPSLILNRADIDKFAAFVTEHSIKQIFIAKDHGAYVGASVGEKNNCIFYFKGCDPSKDKDYYDTAHARFGGDDFGEHLDANIVIAAAADPQVTTMKFTITAGSMKVESFC
ncbi:DUF3085 domain-containing protein [Massilia sp. CCM 8734]|uniref:DUF3085 domain-containing protein n=1 Tax=Massilia sp. CCM 8734 TaxID=2609283 RepID=UPI00142239B0|nr:DUF3085 domain-containing protein [Massilia sp. CCM 8734]NHZ99106.1 DUF3085 domain-containing protein [Massilia sp. CCM 8734]